MIQLPIVQKETSNQYHETLTFDVPVGVRSISFELQTDKMVWLTYIVYDVQQNMRVQYLHKNTPQPVTVHIEAEKTSPYTLYGPIEQGTWKVDFSILTEEAIEALDQWATLAITLNEESFAHQVEGVQWQNPSEPSLNVDAYPYTKVYNESKRWYKGDFHTHTIFSDGQMTREENMKSAAQQQLDFFVATDHNIVPTSWFEDTSILVIPGVEVTALLGHFNILGAKTSPFVTQNIKEMYAEEGMNAIIEQAHEQSVIAINHPFLTKWKWLFKETPLARIHAIEVCNDPTYPDNAQATEWALSAWNHLLNDGYAITGIGGSDSHLKPTERYEGSELPSLIGDPGTFVYCEELSANNVLSSVLHGHVVVSREERIQFKLEDLLPGETTAQLEGIAYAKVDTKVPIYFEWIVDGQVVKQEHGTASSYSFDFTENPTYHWLRVDVRYYDGQFYGFTNPIYFGEKEPSFTTWGQLLEHMKDELDD